jgi:hypothetical protein
MISVEAIVKHLTVAAITQPLKLAGLLQRNEITLVVFAQKRAVMRILAVT